MFITGYEYDNYLTSTEPYESLKVYIEMKYNGLKDTIIELLVRQKEMTIFSNDMATFETKDGLLTLLVHLGDLAYDLLYNISFNSEPRNFRANCKYHKSDGMVEDYRFSEIS